MAKFYENTQFEAGTVLASTVLNAFDARVQSGLQVVSQALSDMGSGDYVLDNPDLTTELKVTASSPADMIVHVATGIGSISGLLCQNEASKALRIASPTSNNRYTIVQISKYGVISTKNGAEAGSPTEPDVDTDNMKLAAIYLPQSTTKIEDTDGGFGYIIDRRVIWGYGFAQVADHYGFGTTTPRKRVDILDTSDKQLRLTYTDNSVYADLGVDSNGYFSIVSTGKRYGINNTSPASMLDVRDTPVPTIVFDGVGLDDLTSVTVNQNYWYFNDRWIMIEIDGTSPDTFKWGLCASGSFVAIAYEYEVGRTLLAGANDLLENLSFNFTSNTGHTIGDQWKITIPAPDSVITCHGIDVAQPGGTNWRAMRMSELDVLIGKDVCSSTLYIGYANTVGGDGAMRNAYDARYNTAWGYYALRNVNNGGYNTAVGAYTNYDAASPEGNTSLGYSAGRFATGDYGVYLGRWSGAYATNDNELWIANSDTMTPLIWGDFTNDIVRLPLQDRGGQVYNVNAYGADPTGVADSRTAINDAATAAGGGTVYLPKGTYKISSNITLDENLKPEKGAMLSIDVGVVVTITGTIQVGRWQIFSGLGTVAITGNMDYVYPEWWGGIPDGITEVQDYIQSALDCGDIPVSLAKGTYLVNDHILLDTNDQIIGTGDQSLIQIKSEATTTIRLFEAVDSAAHTLENIRLQNFRINGAGDVRTDDANATPAILLANCDNVLIEGLTIENMHQGGVFLGWDYNTDHVICSNVKIINNTFQNLGYQGSYTPEAILIGSGEKILIQGNTIKDCAGIGGINLEANRNGISDVRIIGNTITDVLTWGILIQVNGSSGNNYTSVQNILVKGNYIHSPYYGIQVKFGATPALPENIIIEGNIIDGGTAFWRGSNGYDVAVRGFSYRISSIKYWHDAVYDQALPAGDIPAGLWGIYTFQVGTNGTIDVTGDNNSGAGYATEALAIAALAATTASHVRMGYITIQAPAASIFVPGTTPLYGAAGTTAQNTNFYSLPMADRSGIYACNARVIGNTVKNHTGGIDLIYNSDAINNELINCETGISGGGATSPYPPDITSVSYLILGNSIKDPARLDNATLYGIYFGNASARGIIRDNIIEDRNPSPSMAYGIYCVGTGNDLDIGANLIYGAQTQDIFNSLSAFYTPQSAGFRALSGTGAYYQHFDISVAKAFGPEDGNFIEVNPTANVNLTPYGPLFNTTYAGWWVKVRNVSATGNYVNFNVTGLNHRIYAGESASFYYTGTAWVLVYSGQIDLRATASPTFANIELTSGTLRLTYTDGTVFTDLKTDSSGVLNVMPSSGNINIMTYEGDVVTYDDEVVFIF